MNRQIFKARVVKQNEKDQYIVTCGEIMYYEHNGQSVFESMAEAESKAEELNKYINWDIIGVFVMGLVKAELKYLNIKK